MILSSAVFYNNCGQSQLYELSSVDQVENLKLDTDISFSEITVPVDVNKIKEIDLIPKGSFGGSILFEDNNSATQFETANGKVSLIDLGKVKIKFEPAYGFRGSFPTVIKVIYNQYKQEVIKVNFTVQNPLQNFRPALAVRAAECLLCHANIKGDLISDMGYKSSIDLSGPDRFFNSKRPYWDQANNIGYIHTSAFEPVHSYVDPNEARNPKPVAAAHSDGWGSFKIDGRVIVPQVDLQSLSNDSARNFIIDRQGKSNLASYLNDIIINKDLNPNRQVLAKSLVYIGAPTADEVRAAGHLVSPVRQRFVKGSDSSPDLIGLELVQNSWQNFFTNSDSSSLVCDGDIFVDGVVWLKNLKIQSEEGCRIHATQSVFISGAIEYIDESALTNLQITSAVGIYMGLGMCYDCYADLGWNNNNFLVARTSNADYWTNQGLRNYKYDQSLLDFQLVSKTGNLDPIAGIPNGQEPNAYASSLASRGIYLLDANSRYPQNGTGQKLQFLDDHISYRRLLLNAPSVHSRYLGDFQGSVIAEFAMWRLGQFTFKFDPVFKVVPIFPLLDLDRILKIAD